MHRLLFFIVLSVLLCAGSIAAQSSTTTDPATQPSDEPTTQDESSKDKPGRSLEDIHWAPRIGLRVRQINDAFPLVDRVVLVPDAATYVDEVSKWSPKGRWPVLFEEHVYAPMFIRRFEPAQIIRRESVGSLPNENAAREQQLIDTVIGVLGGKPAMHRSIGHVLRGHKYDPPGVVMTSVNDPAWTAALALAAGRAQPIAFLSDNFGRPNGALNAGRAKQLDKTVRTVVSEQGFSYLTLGDAIETVTICRKIAGRIKDSSIGTNDPVAVTDYLGRRTNGERYAFVGWIFGDEARCAYTAMCSLFLDRTSARFVNTYPDQGSWAKFKMDAAEKRFRENGFETRLQSGQSASAQTWTRSLRAGVEHDLLFVNSKGNRSFFDLSSGRLHSVDVPILNTPSAVHFVHSWSFAAPGNIRTVGAQWLEHGAYAYVGAVHEPYLAAFVPPTPMSDRLVHYVPFLVAARHWSGPEPLTGPWKVNTYGDPLMVCLPPDKARRKRVDRPAEYGIDLQDHARQLLSRVKDSGENENAAGELFAEAMRTLALVGRDDIAVDLWSIAEAQGHEGRCARAALGPLFRSGARDDFMRAFQSGASRDPMALDMLWHLMTPALGSTRHKNELLVLQSAVRDDMPEIDLERLAPHLVRVFGKPHAIGVIERHIRREQRNYVRKQLEKLADSVR